MGFSADKAKLERKFSRIPSDVDVLITHLPPRGIRDLAGRGPTARHWGGDALLAKVLELRPRVHLFGHVHECAGYTLDKEHDILFVNGAADMSRCTYTLELHLGSQGTT